MPGYGGIPTFSLEKIIPEKKIDDDGFETVMKGAKSKGLEQPAGEREQQNMFAALESGHPMISCADCDNSENSCTPTKLKLGDVYAIVVVAEPSISIGCPRRLGHNQSGSRRKI